MLAETNMSSSKMFVILSHFTAKIKYLTNFSKTLSSSRTVTQIYSTFEKNKRKKTTNLIIVFLQIFVYH